MARLANRGAGLEGQLYIRYRIFHLGIERVEGKKNIKWIRPRRWFLEQPEFDDSKRIAPPTLAEGVTDATLSVVVPRLKEINALVSNQVDQPMLLCNPP